MRFLRIFLLCAAIGALVVPVASAGGYTDASYYTPVGTVGQPYSHTVSWKQGTGCPPYGYSVVGGDFPPGLALSSDGHITGTPTREGTYTFYIRQTDNCGIEGEGNAPFVITIRPGGPPLSVSSASTPGAEVDVPYAATLAAAGGGSGAHVWSLTAGQLPAGVSLSADGALTGTPTAAGSYTFTATVSNGSTTASKAFTIVVIAGIAFTDAPVVPFAEVRTPYSAKVTDILHITGGVSPYTYAPVSGFPFGIGFDSATGTIFGSPREPGVVHLTIAVHDANGAVKQTTLDVTVLPRIHFVTRSLDLGVAGKPYRARIAVSGGKTPSWAVGGLPAGLRFDRGTGTISGVPRRAGSFGISVVVTDALGAKISTHYVLRVSR